MPHTMAVDPYEVMMKHRYIQCIGQQPDGEKYAVSEPHGQGSIFRRPIGEGIDITYVQYGHVSGTLCNDPRLGMHSFEFCYVLEGKMNLLCLPSGQRYALQEGDLAISRYQSDTTAFEVEASDFRAITMSFDPYRFAVDRQWTELIMDHVNDLLQLEDYRVLPAPAGLSSLFRQFVPSGEAASAGRFFHWRSVAFRLLSECLEWLEQHKRNSGTAVIALGNEDRRLLAAAGAILEERPGNPPSLDELARICRMNKNKLKRGFKQQFGMTVTEYVLACKAECGKELLGCMDKSITEVAMELGYRNPSKFSSMFKKQVGLSPREWRSLSGTGKF